jgi:hypothetical protein
VLIAGSLFSRTVKSPPLHVHRQTSSISIAVMQTSLGTVQPARIGGGDRTFYNDLAANSTARMRDLGALGVRVIRVEIENSITRRSGSIQRAFPKTRRT